MKKIFNLQNLIYLSIIALPAYAIRFSVFGIPTNVFEILAFSCITVFFISTRKKNFKIDLSGQKKYIIPIVMVIVGLLASTLANEAYRSGFGAIKGWFVVPLAFSWIVAFGMDGLEQKKIFKAIYFSAFLVSCIALAYFFFGNTTFDGRLQAFYNSPNYLAMYIAPAVLVAIALLGENKKFYSFSLIVMMLVLYLTFSYASWGALILAGSIMAIMKKGVSRKAVLLLGAVIALFVFLQVDSQKMKNLVSLEERSSLASRMMIWSSAERILEDNLLFGIGPNQFQDKYLEYQKYFSPYLEWAVPQPHNLYLAFWLQAGIVGFIGFSTLVFMWFRDAIRDKKDVISIAALAVMAYVLIHGFFDTTYFKQDLAVIFWLNFIFAIKKRP